jgi:hypothetical protein
MTPPKGKVRLIRYVCRAPYDDEGEDYVVGFWDGTIDTWGKLTIIQVPSGPPVYLFPDEITVVDEVEL